MKTTFLSLLLIYTLSISAWKRQSIWPKGKIPDNQPHQIAAMTDESRAEGFKPDKHRMPYLEWFDAPDENVRTGGCMILISGGSYQNCCDINYIKQWRERFTQLGFQCVNFVYRTPRPIGLPIYQTAWEDGQRAVRIVRSEAKKRGFDPEKIGVVSMSAGSHLALLLATSSQTPAYAPVDKLDSLPCHINWAVVNAPAYVTSDGETGTPATRQGYGKDVKISSIFKFDEKTCPMSLHHGGKDKYSPNGSTLVYRELRKRHIPAELHLYPNKGHGAFGLERGVEFMRQMGYLGELQPEVRLMDRFASDYARRAVVRENVWPEGKMPCAQAEQDKPYIEWHFPKKLKTKAIQIIYSGGAYNRSKPDDYEVAPARRYLNERGMTVVTLNYRAPRPSKENGLAKHTTAWQDLQRAIKIVRSKADSLGLNPKQIGIMGSSAGGHLTLMGVTSSLHQSYLPIDEIDKQPCDVQWGIAIYPAYCLTDGAEQPNKGGGNDDSAVLVPEFSFDIKTSPMLFIHGDADGWAAMNSVKAWEKLRAMGIQSELHTLATRKHCFQKTASPGTGSYTWLDRIADFINDIIKEDKALLQKSSDHYLFSYFMGNATEEQQICMAVSDNGLDFTPLYNGRPVISADTISLSGGVRDPHILRGHDGWFRMVVTDMDWQKGKWSNRGIVMLRSRDLIHWEHHTVHFPDRFAGKDPAKANAVWAPQTIYDPSADKYLVYFSLHSEKDGPYPKDAVYYAYANNDFSNLEGDPILLFPYSFPTIDSDIVQDENGQYHLFFNSWGGPDGLGIHQFVFKDLHRSDTWVELPGKMQPNNATAEGVSVYQLTDGTWIMMYDCFKDAHYEFCRSNDLKHFELVKKTSDFQPRHGSVIRISEKEYQKLISKFL